MTRRRTKGFTLIEMLTVLVIIGILLAATLPAVTHLMKSSGLTVAAREVSDTLSLARQYAITHRTVTRVVFPCSLTTLAAWSATGTNQAPSYQSYAVLEFGATTNYISKWEFLPVGTVFMSDGPQPPLIGTLPPSLDANMLSARLQFPTNTDSVLTVANSGTLAYIEFGPTGAATALANGGSCSFTITEGLVNGTNVTLTSINSNTSGKTLANYATFTVDPLVGRIQVTRP